MLNKQERKSFGEAFDREGILSPFIYNYSDFINYRPGDHQSCRVVRLVGPGRCIVMFTFKDNPFVGWGPREYTLSFLHEDGNLVDFDAKAVMDTRTGSWDRIIGEWLVENGAQEFKGRGWADKLAKAVHGVCLLWGSLNPWSQE